MRLYLVFGLLIWMAAVGVACGQSEPAGTETPVATVTSAPKATFTPAPTATPTPGVGVADVPSPAIVQGLLRTFDTLPPEVQECLQEELGDAAIQEFMVGTRAPTSLEIEGAGWCLTGILSALSAGESEGSVSIVAIPPATSRPLHSGEEVAGEVTVEYVLPQDSGAVGLEVQGDDGRSLGNTRVQAPMGEGTLSLSQGITVPDGVGTIDMLVPLFVSEASQTSIVDVRSYRVESASSTPAPISTRTQTPVPTSIPTPTPVPTSTPTPTPTVWVPQSGRQQVAFEGASFDVDLAVTPQERTTGLMGRQHLDDTEGMLFIFEAEGYHSFWMKGMVIPLDIVWIDADGVVAGVTADLPPAPEGTTPPSYLPPRPVRFVLEINAGLAEVVGIGAGSRARFVPGLGG